MRKIFIDCGANNGCSVIKFKKERDPDNEYEYHSFEANDAFLEDIEATGAFCYNKAVWIEDAEVTFYVVVVDKYGRHGADKTGASTLNEEKNKRNMKNHREVEAVVVDGIDLSKWILDNFTKDDHIVLKMDIEGSEYEVLEKMVEDKTFEMINELLIEFHWNKCGISEQRHDELYNKLLSYEIPITEWDAL
jgi:FkbM family methyltransferase